MRFLRACKWLTVGYVGGTIANCLAVVLLGAYWERVDKARAEAQRRPVKDERPLS